MTLEEKALQQFDQLHKSGDLLWHENDPIYVECEGFTFNFEFRIAPSLKKKPQNEDEGDPRPKHAFQDSNTLFTLGLYGQNESHKLVLNKYCTVRPQFVLHTVEYEPQTEGLNANDLEAAMEALRQMGDGYMVIFNCGKDAGASVGHKHLQLLPKAKHIDELWKMNQWRNDPSIRPPYRYGMEPISDQPSRENLYDDYATMLDYSNCQRTEPHNMILTSQWMMVIPRRKAWIDEIAANAAAMVGMVWCNSEAQFEGWIRRGIRNVLAEMGVPWAS